MQKFKLFYLLIVLSLSCLQVVAQTDLSDKKWSDVVRNQPEEWYGTDEAIRIAENVLLYQRDIGGWPKNIQMHLALSEAQKKDLQELQKTGKGATTDNGATCLELTFLSKVFHKTGDERFKSAFVKGIQYLLMAQYDNGGWPQFYPLQEGYYSHITYNDNSMVNIMEFMYEVSQDDGQYSAMIDDATRAKAIQSYDKGIDIILKTQYEQNGKLTIWCAQHDAHTLKPAKARSYELPSLSGGESASIVRLLMKIDNPTPAVVNAVQSAVTWFKENKIEGIRVERYTNSDGLPDRRVVVDQNAPPIWARFYDLVDNRPFFCDRDGIKKYALSEIGYERRTGYSWYGNWAQAVFEKYKKWQPKWAKDLNVLD